MVDHHHHNHQHNHHHDESPRPRLQALREQLEKEPITKLTSDLLRKSPSTTTTTTTTKKAIVHRPSLDDILRQLEQLPNLPTTSSTTSPLLMDRYQRNHSYLRLSLSERCNLRCQYCMPPEGVPLQPNDQLLQTDELLQLTKIFVNHGVDKIRLTGGEPLLRHDLVEIVQGLQDIGNGTIHTIGMTTNGVTLSRHIQALVQAGLTHVNISLDTLKPDKFMELTRRPGWNKVWASIEAACDTLGTLQQQKHPQGRVKINCVVMKGVNEDELMDFCLLTRDYPLDVRFIEWMPFAENGWNQGRFVSYQTMLDHVAPLQLERLTDGPNDTTKWWTLPGNDSKGGRIGFITSMSQHFCASCNRLRLTADGQIKVCLFGSTELSLRDALRQGVPLPTMEKLIAYAIQQKPMALGGHGSAQGIANANDNRPMTLIGG